jgi:hypothetical protein
MIGLVPAAQPPALVHWHPNHPDFCGAAGAQWTLHAREVTCPHCERAHEEIDEPEAA